MNDRVTAHPLFKIINFREVNYENVDLNFFEGIEPDSKKVFVNTSFGIDNFQYGVIELFVHVGFNYKESKKKEEEDFEERFFHADFIAKFDMSRIKEFTKIKKGKTGFHKDIFSQILGISISTTRGYIIAKTMGTFTQQFIFPIINPLKLIEKYKFRERDGYLFVEN